jgi:hypothetical protein
MKRPGTTSTLDTVARSETQLPLDPDYTLGDAAKRVFKRMTATTTNATAKGNAPTPIYIEAATYWLPIIEQRINDSVLPVEYEANRQIACQSGEWLEEDVARSAIDFFFKIGDLLPNEPYIYSSKSGQLVAEFEKGAFPITAVVSPDLHTLMAIEPDGPSQTSVSRRSNNIRQVVQDLKARLSE